MEFEEVIIRLMGPLLKGVFVIPFISFYLISKRKNEFVYNNSHRPLFLGLMFMIIHILMAIIVEILIINGLIIINSPDDFSMVQLVINIPFFFSTGLLLMGTYRDLNKRITKTDIMNSVIFILLSASITAFTNQSLIYRTNIILYFVASYFLINNFVMTGLTLEKYQNDYYFALIGAVIITFDPLLYLTTYKSLYDTYPLLDMAFYYRYMRYLVSSIAVIFLLIPHLKFARKISNKKLVPYDTDDSLVINTIKRLYNETQKIYGRLTIELFHNARELLYQDYDKKISFNNVLKLKGVNYKVQKLFFKELLRVYNVLFSKKLVKALINKISDDKNKELINECFSYALNNPMQ